MKKQIKPFTIHYDKKLPIYDKRDEFLELLDSNQVVIVSGETGSGKTTHIPLFALDFLKGSPYKVACTQPRRLAAISLSTYVKSLVHAPNSENVVGCRVRFKNSCTSDTRVVFCTDGMLLQMITKSFTLDEFGVVIIDEAHERSINIDFLLSYIRTLLRRRSDLKLVISSATLNNHLFSKRFNHAPLLTVSGRMFPVDIRYRPLVEMWDGEKISSYLECVSSIVKEICENSSMGDILIFLPTVEDIHDLVLILQSKKYDVYRVLPLHSKLTLDSQKEIFSEIPQRKIVVSTNIAETSLTVPKIRYVIDSGLVRMSSFDTSSHITRMPIVKVSRASAIQRAGRAGRVSDGVCFRLFSEDDFLNRHEFTLPEVKRTNLSTVILQLHTLGFGKVETFSFIEAPSRESIVHGYKHLQSLKVMNRQRKLTSLGFRVASLPFDPAISVMLVYAQRYKVVDEIRAISSALSVFQGSISSQTKRGGGLFFSKKYRSDFITFVKIWYDFTTFCQKNVTNKKISKFCIRENIPFHLMREWYYINRQIELLCKSDKKFITTHKGQGRYEDIHKALLHGFKSNILVQQGNGMYRGEREHDIIPFPSSVVIDNNANQVIVCQSFIETKRIFSVINGGINPRWLIDLFKKECSYLYEHPYFDSVTGEVYAQETVMFHGLKIIEQRKVLYSLKRREEAHIIFIEEALVKGQIKGNVTFLEKNKKCIEMIKEREVRLRDKSYFRGESCITAWYKGKLSGVASVKELKKILRNIDPNCLVLNETYLLSKPFPPEQDFPRKMKLGDQSYELSYIYDTKDEYDGITVHISLEDYLHVPYFYWQWGLESLQQRRIQFLTDVLGEKGYINDDDKRKLFVYLKEQLLYCEKSYVEVLQNVCDKFSETTLPEDILTEELFPPWHFLTVAIYGTDGALVEKRKAYKPSNFVSYLDVHRKSRLFSGTKIKHRGSRFPQLTSKNVKLMNHYNFVLYPALTVDKREFSVEYFHDPLWVDTIHSDGVKRFFEQQFSQKLAWELQSKKIPEALIVSYDDICGRSEFEKLFFLLCDKELFCDDSFLPYDPEEYAQYCHEQEARLPLVFNKIIGLLTEINERYNDGLLHVKRRKKKHSASVFAEGIQLLEEEIEHIFEFLFIESTPLELIEKIPVYLESIVKNSDLILFKTELFKSVKKQERKYMEELFDYEKKRSVDLWSIRTLWCQLELSIVDTFYKLIRSGKIIGDNVFSEIETLQKKLEMKLREFGEMK